MTLSETDKQVIRDAVVEAEARTSGEIVACLMAASDRYTESYLRSALVFAVTAGLFGLAGGRLHSGWGFPGLYTAEGIVAIVVVAGLLGLLVVRTVPRWRRLMAGAARLQRMVELQAWRTFTEEEVFATVNRTGILIFVSAFERRVEVIADSGINRVAAPDAWVGIVSRMTDLLAEGKVPMAFEYAVRECGAILREQGLAVGVDDRDELPNELRIRRLPDDPAN